MRRLALSALLTSSLAFAGPRIVVDPGHGGTQEGAVGPGGFFEKTLALELSQIVKAALEKELGATVTLTRESDVLVPLADRVALANRQKPQLFISIHANSMPTRAMREHTLGIETFFLSASASDSEASTTAARENDEAARSGAGSTKDTLAFILADLQRSESHDSSSKLAYAVHQSLIAHLHAQDRGVQQAPFYVLTGVEAPAILVETGFISNPSEGQKLKDPAYRQALAEAIVSGVREFLKGRSSAAP